MAAFSLCDNLPMINGGLSQIAPTERPDYVKIENKFDVFNKYFTLLVVATERGRCLPLS